MRLVSLAVQNFRGLERAVIGELGPGLNLVVGPNESGKSRLVHALFYALFERYKGESEDKKALRTYGGAEPPYVEVRFEARGKPWTVKKQFLKQAFARLEGDGRTWADDDAESMLREIWGTRVVQGKRDADQYLGLWPLLWVRQGAAWMAPQAHLNDDARARLRDVLTSQIDEVAAGPLGERIVARAEKERERYWTATGKETGELAAARARHAEAEAQLILALAKRAEAHGEADELATLERDVAALDARLAPQRVRVTEAAARLARAQEIAARLRAYETDAARCKAEMDLAERALKDRADAEGRIAAIAQRTTEAQGSLTPLREARASAAEREREAAARSEEARLALERAHAAQARARRRAQRTELLRREHDAEERVARAKAHEARVTALQNELVEAWVDEKQIERVRKANEAATKVGAALAAVSAEVLLTAARDLTVDGEKVPEGGSRAWTCDGATRIVIEGVGAIEVRPGGADVAQRRGRAQDAKKALAKELERVGARSVADAEAKFAKRTALKAQLAQAEPLMVEAAPDGIARLEEEARARTAEREAVEDAGDDAPSTAEADALLAAASDTAGRARAERDALHNEVARADEAILRREHAVTQLAADRADAEARLAPLPARELLAAAAAETRTKWIDARTLAAALAEERARSGDAGAQLGFDQEKRALDRLESERAEKHTRAVGLAALVRAHGGEELHERAQRAESDVEEKGAALRATEARALAARELVSALHAARRDVQHRLVAPVLDRARPYLESLLPGRGLRMDEDWSVLGLHTGDVEEAFESLSGGAREQVSLVARLALAEVLGDPEPLPLVLDDALVNTDPARLEAMLGVLQRAAQKQQIVLFSCHEAAFARLTGATRFTLAGR
jgi:DNA repair exonuclease SbcCD ATPase subunit